MDNMVKIKLVEFIGENCITIDQGAKVFAKIHPLLAVGNAVELEFEGVQVFASPFFNNAIGKLLEDLKPERAYLTHISHFLGKQEDVEKKLPPNVRLAYDNLVIDV